MTTRKFIVALASVALRMQAQAPSISHNGIVNAASYLQPLARGSIASVFGSNLAPSSMVSPPGVLPLQLGGVTVLVNNQPVPLFSVSPGQINFQVSSNLIYSYRNLVDVPVVVQTAAGTSNAENLVLNPVGPGVFTSDASGCGKAAALNVGSDGTLSYNTGSAGAAPGDYMAIYGTGFGDVTVKIPDGSPAPAFPPDYRVLGSNVSVDGIIASVLFQGRAPTLIGVDQINVQIPPGTREGCAVPIQFDAFYAFSQTATVSVSKTRMACMDPPPDSFGTITLRKTVYSGTAHDGEVDTLSASFDQSPGKAVPQYTLPIDEVLNTNTTLPSGGTCTVPGYISLGAGMLSLMAGSYSQQAQPSPSASGVSYTMTLPAGTLVPGNVSIDASGETVGPFSISGFLGADFIVSNPPASGSHISLGAPVTVAWTGGDPNGVMTVEFVSHSFQQDMVTRKVAKATAGSVLFGIVSNGDNFIPTGTDVEMVVREQVASPVTFSAPGLSLGGRVVWIYERHFGGLQVP